MIKTAAAILFFIWFLLNSCANLSTLQTPVVSDYKKGQTGIGVLSLTTDHTYCCAPEVYVRYGFYNNFDGGLKMGYLYITGDLKYQLFKEPFYGAIDFSFTRGGVFTLWGDNEKDEIIGYNEFSPMLIFGSENIFGGAKLLYFTNTNYNLYGFFCGALIGDTFGILPVLNIYFQDHGRDTAIVPNIGFQWKF